jgi:hypothetical protein
MTGIAELHPPRRTGRLLACRYPGAGRDTLSEQNGQFRRGPDTACWRPRCTPNGGSASGYQPGFE